MGGEQALLLGLLFVGVVGVFAAVAYLTGKSAKAFGGDRLDDYSDVTEIQELNVLSDSQKQSLTDVFAKKVLKPLSGMMKVAGGSQSKMRELLVHAGFRKKGAMEIFMGAKVAMALAFPAATAAGFVYYSYSQGEPLSTKHTFMFSVMALVLGMMLPTMWLRRKAASRILAIKMALPDALDLLVVCVESGLGLDAALLRIANEMQESGPELSEELTLLNLEIKAGKPREECFRNFGLRTGCDEAKSLAARINQAAKFGTNLAHSLRIHSESLRQKRRQEAEEAAAKTTVKLLFPLVFFIFPAIFVVILGPAAVKVMRTLT